MVNNKLNKSLFYNVRGNSSQAFFFLFFRRDCFYCRPHFLVDKGGEHSLGRSADKYVFMLVSLDLAQVFMMDGYFVYLSSLISLVNGKQPLLV